MGSQTIKNSKFQEQQEQFGLINIHKNRFTSNHYQSLEIVETREIIIFRQSLNKMQNLLNQKLSMRCRFIVNLLDYVIDDNFDKPHDLVHILLVYPRIMINLQQSIEKRMATSQTHSQHDASFVIQCISRGLKYLEQTNEEEFLLTPSSVVILQNSMVSLSDSFHCICSHNSLRQPKQYLKQWWSSNKNEYCTCSSEDKEWGIFLKKIDQKWEIHSLNLLSLGLIALKMLDPTFQIQYQSKSLQKQGIKEIKKRIQSIKDNQLKWQIWLLTSEYPTERKQIYQYLNPLFQIDSYPIEILLRNTTFNVDMQAFNAKNKLGNARLCKNYTNTTAHSQCTASNTIISKERDLYPQFNKVVSISRPLLNLPNYSSKVNPFDEVSFNKSQITNETVNPQRMERPNEFSYKLTTNNSKSKLSEITQISLHRNQQLYHNNDQQSCKNQVNLINYHDESNQIILQPQQINQRMQTEILSDGSIVQIDLDMLSEEFNQTQEEDFMGDINVRHYSINRPADDYESKQYHRIYNSILSEIVEEESIADSINTIQKDLQYTYEQYQLGCRYEGFKMNGKRHGFGKLHYQSGEFYEGNWKDNMMEGFGKLFYNADMIAYQGYWKNDCFNGHGKLYNKFSSSGNTIFDYRNFSELENEWIQYEGQFFEDLKSGKGKLILPQGQFFEGFFHNDLAEGEGVFTQKNGNKIYGIWKESILVHCN